MKTIFIAISCVIILSAGSGLQYAYGEKAAEGTFKYESKGKRDPFVPLIGQEKAKGMGLDNVISADDINLEGIATVAGGKYVAIMNGVMVKENDKFGVLQIKKISHKIVQFSIEGKDYTLQIRKPEEEKAEGAKE